MLCLRGTLQNMKITHPTRYMCLQESPPERSGSLKMKKTEAGDTKYAESCKPIGIDAYDRHDDSCGIMVHVPGDHNGLVDAEKYFKYSIEKNIELKYRRFSFSASDLIHK